MLDGEEMCFDFGISTMVYYQKPIEKILPYLVKGEINNIEIRPKENHFQPQTIDEIFKLKRLLAKKKIVVKAIHMPMDGVDISHPQSYERTKSVREVEKTILMACHLGANLVIVHPGGKSDSYEDKKNRVKLSIESLKEIMDFSKNWKVKIALENTLPGRVGDKWEDLQQIIEIVSSHDLGICLDTGHYLLNYQEIKQGFLNLDNVPINWQDNLLHIHIHDNDGKRDLHLLPQEGLFPWNSFMRFIKQINYSKALIIEVKEQDNLPNYLHKVNTSWNNLKYLT